LISVGEEEARQSSHTDKRVILILAVKLIIGVASCEQNETVLRYEHIRYGLNARCMTSPLTTHAVKDSRHNHASCGFRFDSNRRFLCSLSGRNYQQRIFSKTIDHDAQVIDCLMFETLGTNSNCPK
jgi:hypothetical protein